jgi:two-component system chemotaxis response regulator CheB
MKTPRARERRRRREEQHDDPRSAASAGRASGGSGNGNGNGNGNGAAARSHETAARQATPGQWRNGREFRLIAIGASAGGVEALSRLAQTLPPKLPAAVFVVLHVSPGGPSLLPEILSRAGHLPAIHGRDGEQIRPGRIYVALPDHHLLIKPGLVVVSRGPRESNARPAVDPLFRTAARSYGPWAVGVILSGGLDDGTLGMMDIKRYGGITLVQDPDEAMFPSMPRSAIENVQVDRVLSLDEMGPLLARLAREPVPVEEGAAFMARKNGGDGDSDIAEVGAEDLKTRNMIGPPSKFTCPECGGALWEIQDGKLLRYRCHVGHGYTAESLMAAQGEKLEDALWSALRALEETAGMRRRMANRARRGGWEIMARN